MEANPADWSAGQNYHFLTSAVAPRPIAWVTTVDADGISNAAPFSWFQAVCSDPPMVMIAFGDRSDGSQKDTLRNIEATGEFVVNGATRELLEPMVASSGEFPPETSELDALNLAVAPSAAVKPSRIAASPLHLECRFVESHRYGKGAETTVMVGEVVHIHCDDAFVDARGNFRANAAHLLARLGGADYLAVDETFAYRRPKPDDEARDA